MNDPYIGNILSMSMMFLAIGIDPKKSNLATLLGLIGVFISWLINFLKLYT